jgi:NCS1 family nucleobase:cation symporter-1
VATGSYYLLCRFFPIPACSDEWVEVGDEISKVRLAEEDTSDNLDYDIEKGSQGVGERKGYSGTTDS